MTVFIAYQVQYTDFIKFGDGLIELKRKFDAELMAELKHMLGGKHNCKPKQIIFTSISLL